MRHTISSLRCRLHNRRLHPLMRADCVSSSAEPPLAMTATLQGTSAANVPAPQSIARAPRSIGVPLAALGYVVLVPTGTMSFASTFSFTFTLPNGTSLAPGSSAYVGFYDPVQGQWQTLLGPGIVTGQTISFPTITGSVTLTAGTVFAFVGARRGCAKHQHVYRYRFCGAWHVATTRRRASRREL